MTSRSTLFLALALAGFVDQGGAPPAIAPAATNPALAVTWADRALASVVLLVRRRSDGGMFYGAGAIVGDGLAITSLHVVGGSGAIEAMLHDPTRASYTAFDGGIARLVAENPGALRPATLLRADPEADLALVRVDTGGRPVPRLELRATPVRVGERVIAIGHPGESAWSVSLGVVSALPHDAIQHDAATTTGSSGGPLLDAEGRLVGINTARLVEGEDRLGLARPADAVKRLLEATPAREALAF